VGSQIIFDALSIGFIAQVVDHTRGNDSVERKVEVPKENIESGCLIDSGTGRAHTATSAGSIREDKCVPIYEPSHLEVKDSTAEECIHFVQCFVSLEMSSKYLSRYKVAKSGGSIDDRIHY